MLTVERNGFGEVALVPEGWRNHGCVSVFVKGVNARIAVRMAIAAHKAGDLKTAYEWEYIAHRAHRANFEPKGNAYPVYPSWISTSKSKRSLMHDRWHAEVRKRVRFQAELYAAGDEDFEVLADIYESAMHFDSSMSKPEPRLHEDGSSWWQVGRNGSHDFYLGFMPDGSYGRASCGEPAGLKWDDPFVESDWWHKSKCEPGKEGYLGHY